MDDQVPEHCDSPVVLAQGQHEPLTATSNPGQHTTGGSGRDEAWVGSTAARDDTCTDESVDISAHRLDFWKLWHRPHRSGRASQVPVGSLVAARTVRGTKPDTRLVASK